jgi:hypothetical protein
MPAWGPQPQVKYWHIVLAGVLAFIIANILMVHP